MIFFGILIGLSIMAGTVYLAIDKKSNFPTRVACLIALGVMILTIIICLFMIFTDDTVVVDESVLIVGAPPEKKEASSHNLMVLLVLAIFLLAMFGLIIYHVMQENKKHAVKKPSLSEYNSTKELTDGLDQDFDKNFEEF